MTTLTRRFGWTNAVLTALIAFALVFAPMAGNRSMPCHDHPAHGKLGIEHAPTLDDAHPLIDGKVPAPAVKTCCSLLCGFHIALANERTETPAVIGAVLRVARGDQTGSGLAPSPTLGPPRLLA
jgi:hypothetical protein